MYVWIYGSYNFTTNLMGSLAIMNKHQISQFDSSLLSIGYKPLSFKHFYNHKEHGFLSSKNQDKEEKHPMWSWCTMSKARFQMVHPSYHFLNLTINLHTLTYINIQQSWLWCYFYFKKPSCPIKIDNNIRHHIQSSWEFV